MRSERLKITQTEEVHLHRISFNMPVRGFACKIVEVSTSLQVSQVTRHNFMRENGAFCWPTPPYTAAAGRHAHAAAAAKMGWRAAASDRQGLKRRRRLTWSAHRSASKSYLYENFSIQPLSSDYPKDVVADYQILSLIHI